MSARVIVKPTDAASSAGPRGTGAFIALRVVGAANPGGGAFGAGDPLFMMSLARGLQVIRAFSGVKRGMRIAERSRATGLTRAAVRRCLHTLRELGYVATDGHTYSLRPRILISDTATWPPHPCRPPPSRCCRN